MCFKDHNDLDKYGIESFKEYFVSDYFTSASSFGQEEFLRVHYIRTCIRKKCPPTDSHAFLLDHSNLSCLSKGLLKDHFCHYINILSLVSKKKLFKNYNLIAMEPEFLIKSSLISTPDIGPFRNHFCEV